MDASSRLTSLNQEPGRRKSVPPSKLPYHERLRGRAAHNPFQIGWRGWCDILVRVVERVSIDNLGLITAGVTFYVFLALIPAMIAVVTFYGITTSSLTLETHVSFLHGYLPDQAIEWIAHEIGRVSKAQENGLTLTFLLSLGISLWSMNNAVIALFGAMNIAYGEVEKRGTITLYLKAFGVTLAALLVGILMIGAIVVVPLVFGGDDGGLDYGGRRVTAPALFVMVSIAAATIFRLGPSRRAARWRWISVGAVTVSLGWLAASTLLSWYLSNIADYAAMYGSLGTVIALMFWFYISIYILLLGAELAAEVEHQTMVDTTVGPDQPVGRRGAYVADTVGRASRV
ncbi:YihY/virulence factor BrkB family protein [Acuticoccus sp. I52.16.1]|uniref:YihY/virulence factor BrkB family protein n=1 Tax=Acuticoccus sp. I52.16.1 TaxID=2928472 RepID=UPI001FD52713|nr:YihY/virulence factor BrkB family protein [Acuticoccus sp. I52.16.1]UOM34493.1 YihY/virulence factor BrkB family protein [Acuticoccus sp. I52.16.1]